MDYEWYEGVGKAFWKDPDLLWLDSDTENGKVASIATASQPHGKARCSVAMRAVKKTHLVLR